MHAVAKTPMGNLDHTKRACAWQVGGEHHRSPGSNAADIGSWCVLIAITKKLKVLAWQWSGRASTAAWTALLERIPPKPRSP